MKKKKKKMMMTMTYKIGCSKFVLSLLMMKGYCFASLANQVTRKLVN
jgi:hypothetical protein